MEDSLFWRFTQNHPDFFKPKPPKFKLTPKKDRAEIIEALSELKKRAYELDIEIKEVKLGCSYTPREEKLLGIEIKGRKSK